MSVATTELRRAPLADVRALDLRSPDRDLWSDEAALYDRLDASWAGLDDAAWHVPGAAPSDAGGPDWSLAEHVGHVVMWQEEAGVYTAHGVATGQWPSFEDFDGGDLDRFNERNRAPWTTMPRDGILARLDASRRDLLAQVRRLTDDQVRGDEPWVWVYMTLHGHYLDHLGIVEAWADTLQVRQVDGDPFVPDPRPADHAGFVAQDAEVEADVDRLIRTVPAERWDAEALTPGWTLRDHVAHLADWAEEGVRVLDVFKRRGHWPSDPEEGLDAWNERMVARTRGSSAAETLARYDATHAALLTAIATLSVADLRSPDGWSWTYDCLHGHARKHLAMVGPWCAAQAWPTAPD
jgi:Mycothiol maleylpyruvate isomerase N-terminal domain.